MRGSLTLTRKELSSSVSSQGKDSVPTTSVAVDWFFSSFRVQNWVSYKKCGKHISAIILNKGFS